MSIQAHLRGIKSKMRLRKTYLVEDVTTLTNGTKIYDLDFTDPIMAIYLDFIGQRFDSSDTNRPYLVNSITKIEVVDGSDVLFSCTGSETAAVQLYHTGKLPFMAISSNHAGPYSREQVKLLFGRDENDTEFALDPKKFTNPQLKITHAYTESAGNWKANGQTMTVQALVGEGAPQPRGYFMTKEIYSWAKGTSGDETIDLPRDYSYRFIMVQAIECATPVYAEFSHIKISCNFDEFVPLDETTEDLAHDNWNKYGMLSQQSECIGDGADLVIKCYYPFAWNWGGDVQSWNSGDECVVVRPYSGYVEVAKSDGVALTPGQRALVTGQGFEYFDTEVIGFGNLMDETHWFDPKPWKSVRLILTQAQTAVTGKVVLQQVRLY